MKESKRERKRVEKCELVYYVNASLQQIMQKKLTVGSFYNIMWITHKVQMMIFCPNHSLLCWGPFRKAL